MLEAITPSDSLRLKQARGTYARPRDPLSRPSHRSPSGAKGFANPRWRPTATAGVIDFQPEGFDFPKETVVIASDERS